MPDPEIPETLVDSVRERLCIPWCGAGASIRSGLPGWAELAGTFVEACVRNELDADELDQLNGLRQEGYLDDVLQYCRLFLGEDRYHEVLAHTLRRGDPSATHRELARWRAPAILTTNYDPLLERAIVEETGECPSVLTNQDTALLWRRFARREFFLLKVHGDLERPDTIVLTSGDYSEHVFGNAAFMQFLQRLLVSASILFVDTSLRDPYLLRILDETMFLTKGAGMPHFAIQRFTGSIHRELLRRRFNLHVMTVESDEAKPELLEEIRRRAESADDSP